MEVFLDGKGAFFNGNESDDSDKDLKIIIKIMNSSSYCRVLYKIVSPVLLQELTNNFAVCKHCIGTLLLVQKQSPRGVL